MAELGQQTVEFATLVHRATEDSFLSLKELVDKSKNSEQSDTEKKISLLKYLQKTRQRMLRLHVLAKWCQQVPVVRYCQQLASTLSSHDTCFTQAADSMFFMHEGLQQARAPIYDVPSAIEILLTGTYQRLPQCIDDLGILGTLDEDEQKPALKKLDILLRSKLLETSLPKEVSEVKVSDGTVLLRVDGEFKVLLTLGYRGHLSMWRILHLELLVGERSGFVKLEESRRHHLGDDLERRMAASENPFLLLYSILHELCVALTMDTIVRQAQALRQGRWKDVIRFELISDGSQDSEPESTSLKTPGLKILYWLDFEKKVGDSHLGSCPFIKIEPGQDLQIRCIHSTFVVDPQTDKEAELSLDQSCIDVEKLLLTAISCIRYTRLLEILRELRKNGQICQAADDVLLQYHGDKSEADQKKNGNKFNTGEYGGDEVLRVRVYGSAYISLGINIRNGRFFLQCSRDILGSSSLLECEDVLNQGSSTAADVFISLRSKSILRLFASIGRFLGLKVYEHGLAAVKIQKTILYGSDLLLMGFPHCGSSYFLLMQLVKDFKPLFRLLETQLNPTERSHSVGESSNVINLKDINIGQMSMLEDELNLSLIDFDKVLSSFPNVVGTSENTEHGILSDFSIEPSMQITGSPHSVFSSVVDEVFEVENGTSLVLPLSSPSNTSPIAHLGSAQMNQQRRIISPNWEVNNVTKNSNSSSHFNNVLYSNNLKGIIQANCVSSLPSSPGKTPSIQMLSASKSDHLASLRSIHSVDAMDEDQARSSRLLSPLRRTASRAPSPCSKNRLRSSPSKSVIVSSRAAGPSLWTVTPTYQAKKSGISDVVKHEKNSRKHSLSDMLSLVPSLEGIEELNKRRKISEFTQFPVAVQKFCSSVVMGKTEGCTYGNLLAEANKGNAPSSIYVSALLHVIRHSSLCIKHTRLTSQMDALDISYVEESDLQTPTSNLWFRLPDASKESWQHICLRLGKPGSVYWDVKINDQHFRDLWELQKGSTTTGWGCGVRIATTSDIDSHIRYDPEGVVLSYTSVEDDSIKRLVADLRRLSNARLLSLGMRKLLGVRMDDKLEENSSNLENKITSGSRSAIEVADKMSERIKIKKAFKIEAVGLMSLWFSFGPEVLARFVVEWESGKEGCIMHVSPDQLWPHTKFLEDFINGTEVASLLDCIRLTAGPLLHLASATRPARGSPASAPPMILPGYSSTIPKQNGLVGSPSNAIPPGNPVGSHSLQSAAVLAVAGRPGIVPSSLLPIDVSIVLRGPYWIRIIYRKDFAVDMRCFAGDQVWLQPATPPKEGRAVGGSMPCPQFRPFIMEHVAQELNGLEPNFSNGLVNSNSPNQGSGSRVNVTSSGVIPKSSLAGLNRVSNGGVNSSNSPASAGLPLRRNLGTGVPPINVRGELNTAFIGLGDDGGYGGGWVPLVALKKVLRGILKYLGVLWLFAQLPELLKEILGSILKENEGLLLNLDQEQPALRFFVGGYVFAVSVHRVQLLLQVLSAKRFHPQQPPQNPHEELVQSETSEICDYFSRHVASDPYDASRVASFITLLTLPVSVLREFLKLIAWKKGSPATQAGEMVPTQRPRIELCLENHSGSNNTENSLSKSNIHYDRPHNSVDFVLTVVLDSAHIPQINAAGGAAWLPYCVSVRLRYSFGESPRVSLLGMEGSHGGRACWLRSEDWEMCKQRVTRTVEVSGSSTGDVTQGRLRHVADSLQKIMHSCLQGERGGIKEENQKI
ncbi:hypothetical protein GIB67_027126 [Kingdonia uniflora]|uniref:Mediator of RNA polymerase II transcription subunit 14 n=1 Tax=Kingdonia uniflora TaxID=39325 RepID=A0A7J7P1X6_9MAGN|nr:hypothetical protein GIB67_027126 [Kingdonia uniflora]